MLAGNPVTAGDLDCWGNPIVFINYSQIEIDYLSFGKFGVRSMHNLYLIWDVTLFFSPGVPLNPVLAPNTLNNPVARGSDCVANCRHMSNGDYQSCKTCEGYVTCAYGRLYDRPCPANLLWDDERKRCGWESRTCNIPPTTHPVPTGECIESCDGIRTGIYQSCKVNMIRKFSPQPLRS